MTLPIAIIGAGPAGLFAAETAASAGARVVIYERLPSPARKFLMAGRGGLNLTHSEPLPGFLDRYGDAPAVRAAVEAFPPAAVRAWADGLGADTFVGTSGRVFPRAMKASPLLRAWLRRLDALGAAIETRCDWRGFDDQDRLLIARADGSTEAVPVAATILACGGASWPRLGSNGDWIDRLGTHKVNITPLRAANMGVVVEWSSVFAERFAGAPVKRIALSLDGDRAIHGEMVVTKTGLEGGAVYALSRAFRAAVGARGDAELLIDLRPDLGAAHLAERLAQGRAKDSFSSRLKRGAGLSPVAIGLLREASRNQPPADPRALARLIKAAPIRIAGLQGLDRAISTAGGVALDALDDRFMLKSRPGLFACGEMLDWDAPTGGYLLQACLATGRAAALGALEWLKTPVAA